MGKRMLGASTKKSESLSTDHGPFTIVNTKDITASVYQNISGFRRPRDGENDAKNDIYVFSPAWPPGQYI